MHLYISGASGYIGSFLCRLMASCKIPFTPISLYNPFSPNYIANLHQLNSDAFLVHLSDNSFPSLARDFSCLSNENLLPSSLSNKFKKVIFFSSASVYDTSLGIEPLCESTNHLSNSSYAKNKLLVENSLDLEKDLVLRPTNLYYDFPKRGTILFDLYTQKVNNLPFSLHDPSVMIDFLDLHYVFEFLMYAIRNSLSGVFNLASGCYISGHQLINCLNEPYSFLPDSDQLPPSPFSIKKLSNLGDLSTPSSLFSYKPYFIFS